MEDLRRLVMQMSEDFKEHKSQTENKFNKHEIRMDKQDARIERTDERISGIREIQIEQGEQVKNIEKRLDSIQDDTKFTRRTITGAVITTLIGGLGSLVFFAIKLGGG